MATYRYPSSDFDRGATLLGTLGSFWSSVYAGNHLVEGYATARAQEEAQTFLDTLETVASISRHSVPIFHTDNWHVLVIKESEFNIRMLNYGDTVQYGPQPVTDVTYKYGVSNLNALAYGYIAVKPDGLADVQLILNNVADPTVSLCRGTDFALSDRYITFFENPFENDRISKRLLIDNDGNTVDREITLWLFKGQFDWEHAYTHFGYILGVKLSSSVEYRQLINAVFDSLVTGTSAMSTNLAFSALTGNPVVRESVESIEYVAYDNQGLVVVSDKHTYRYPASCAPTVSVGDTVYAGDFLTTTVTVYDLNTGNVPEDISAITAGVGLLSGNYVDGLTFTNKTVPLVVTTVDGRTHVSFELTGFPSDITAFWDETHRRGVADNKTLANLLDLRENPTDDPTAASLPTSINPLQFLLENVLRYNAFIVKIRVNDIAGNIALKHTRLLRKIIPPWTTAIILLELTAPTEQLVLDTEGTESLPGYTEDVTTFTGTTPVSETIQPAVAIRESVALRLVSGVCR